MKRHRRWIATTTLAVALVVGCAPTTDASLDPGDHVVRLDHGRRERSYIVHVPESVVAPAPVMIALHGGGGTGAGFQEQNGLDGVADREGFIVVYPEGTGVLRDRLHTWNSGDTCCGYALDNDVDDVGYLRAVVRSLAARIEIDPGRLYVTGHSNGAMMAYRFAAEAPELVSAIVPVGGAVDVDVDRLEPPVAVLHIHSVDDPRALYEGGEGPPFPGTERTVNHEAVVPGIEAWAALNSCGAPSTNADQTHGEGADAGQTLDKITWPDCAGGVAVEHYRLAGSGHGWPGVTVGPVWQRHLGEPTTLLIASEAAWAFASQFER